jgi:hypothetical protein
MVLYGNITNYTYTTVVQSTPFRVKSRAPTVGSANLPRYRLITYDYSSPSRKCRQFLYPILHPSIIPYILHSSSYLDVDRKGSSKRLPYRSSNIATAQLIIPVLFFLSHTEYNDRINITIVQAGGPPLSLSGPGGSTLSSLANKLLNNPPSYPPTLHTK